MSYRLLGLSDMPEAGTSWANATVRSKFDNDRLRRGLLRDVRFHSVSSNHFMEIILIEIKTHIFCTTFKGFWTIEKYACSLKGPNLGLTDCRTDWLTDSLTDWHFD